jgi:hypothetical protein
MNPKVAASRTRPLHFRRHGVIFAKSRELQIATLSLLLLFLIAPALQAQTPQPQPPAVRETARPGIAQGFLGWFRQFAPSRRRGRHPHHRCRVLGLRNLRPHPRSQVRPRQSVLQPPVSQIRRR